LLSHSHDLLPSTKKHELMEDKTLCVFHLWGKDEYKEAEHQGMTMKLNILGEGHIILSLCNECAEKLASDPAYN
jgi:hypothetical protein